VHLASISGGTDIVSCFVLGNPALPVWRGEIQGPGLGMAVDVWDDDGKPSPGKRANWSAPSRFRPCRLASGTTRRREIPRRLFRALRQHLVPWRLRRMDPTTA
jgi:acyl-coenzyme A synthetase/AMP-(fatty) acid ligase